MVRSKKEQDKNNNSHKTVTWKEPAQNMSQHKLTERKKEQQWKQNCIDSKTGKLKSNNR